MVQDVVHRHSFDVGDGLRHVTHKCRFITAPAVGEVFKELDRILTPPPAEDVERARNYAALGYAGDFETTSQVATSSSTESMNSALHSASMAWATRRRLL